jgi:adenosylcobinamide-GDP ribazoletransferase
MGCIMHRLALAFQFLTIAPWPRSMVRQPEDLGGSMAFYPVVGAVLGSVLAGVHLIGAGVFPDGVLRPALVILLIVFSGGLHMDGLADVCDGFYAGRTPADALRIMKDPHLGTMGVIGIMSVFLMKVALLSFLPVVMMYTALLVIPVISRAGMVWGTLMATYARPEGGTGAIFFQTLRPRHVWLATAFLCLWTFLWIGWSAAVLLGLAFATTKLFVGVCRRRIGGMTGDTLGALNELLELLTLVWYYPLLRWQIVPSPIINTRFFFPS